MAQRRMLAKSISTSRKVSKLTDFSALLYTWMIPHCDDYGHLESSADIIKAIVAPLRPKSVREFETALKEIEAAGLINVYAIKDEPYLEIVNWNEFQTFRSDRDKTKKYPFPRRGKEKDIENEACADLSIYEEGLKLIKQQFRISLRNNNNDRRFRLIDILAEDKNGLSVLIEVKRETVRPFILTQQLGEYKELYEKIIGRDCRLAVIAPDFEEETIELAKKMEVSLWYDTSHTNNIPMPETVLLREVKVSQDKLIKERKDEASDWNLKLFQGFKEDGVEIVDALGERVKYPKNMRRKNPSVDYWIAVGKFSQAYKFPGPKPNPTWTYPWRGPIKLSKLYYEVHEKYEAEVAPEKNKKRYEEMKSKLFTKVAEDKNG